MELHNSLTNAAEEAFCAERGRIYLRRKPLNGLRNGLNRNPEPVRGSTIKGANPPSAWDQL
jgi:hypothetical protein